MKILNNLVAETKADKNILAIMIFGSFARKEKYSDIDICLIMKQKLQPIEMSKIKLKYLTKFPLLDIQIFQQLPLYIRARILKDGKLLFCNNMDSLYNIAFDTIKEFESYKYNYKSYLEGVLYA